METVKNKGKKSYKAWSRGHYAATIAYGRKKYWYSSNNKAVIDAYVNSLELSELGFIEYSGTNKGQAPYRRSDLLKLHIYGYLNKIRSSRALEIEAKKIWNSCGLLIQ